MKKDTRKKIGKWALRIGTGFLAFAAGLAATFFLVPNRVKNIVFDDPVFEPAEETHFSRFVSKIMNTIDVENDEQIEGLVGSIDNLKIEWKDKNENLPNNYVAINGSLNLEMRNLNDFDLTVDLGVDYNGKNLDLAIGYTGKTFYLALQDLFIKSSYNSTQDLFEKINTLFFNKDVPEDQGLGIEVDIDGIIGSLIGGIDINSLLAGGVDGLGINFGEEIETENEIEAPLSIAIGDGAPIELSLYLNKATDFLSGVLLKQVEIAGIKVSGGLTFNIVEGHKVYGLDDERYVGRRNFANKNFIEVINYKSWFDDIFNLLNKKTVGIDLYFSADQDDGSGAVNIGQILGSIDVDLSKFNLFDYIPKVINADTFSKESVVTKEVKRNEDNEETVVEKLLDNISAGVDLSVGRDEEHYADLNVTYADQDAYLSLNEDVIKAKVDIKTLNLIISKVSTLVEGSEDEQVQKLMRRNNAEEPEEGLFDFITGSTLVTAIKNGHYEGILDVLESISNSADGINLRLNLSSLGLGEDARVELTLDATDNGEKGVTSIKCRDICMAEGIFDLDLSTREFKKENIDKILNDKDNYQPLDFAVGVFDQVAQILDTKKAGFRLEGSLLGDDKLGMSFDGSGQLDYGERYGYGSINIYNHKNAENPVEKSETHPVKVYVDNTSNNKEINDMKLVYGPNGKLKGKLSISSLDDIVAVIKKVIEKQDRRFMKFLDPILKIIYESAIGQIIAGKDYMRLASQGFIHRIAQNIDGTYLELDLSKDLFAGFVVEDMKIHLNFKIENEVKKLESVEIINLKLNETLGNKTVNLKITINDFNPEMENPVNVNDTFMNFSSLATLVQFGIESTELNCYHLTATVKLNLSILTANLKLDFYIEVTGEDTKVYGLFPDIPYVIIFSNDGSTDVGTEFLFEPSKHYDINSGDNVGGYFHIIRNEDHHGILNRNFEQYYYRATSKGFVDKIADYLLAAVLDFNYDLVSQIGNINLNTSTGTAVYEEMFQTNGFIDSSKPEENLYQWDIGMNLNKVSGIEALRTLNASLYGSKVSHNGQESCYLNRLSGHLVVKASMVTINVNADIRLVDIHPDAQSWATDDTFKPVHDRFEKVCNVFNGMSESDKQNYIKNYQDQPGNPKRIYLDSAMPAMLAAYL